jgi:hypothetical protein
MPTLTETKFPPNPLPAMGETQEYLWHTSQLLQPHGVLLLSLAKGTSSHPLRNTTLTFFFFKKHIH